MDDHRGKVRIHTHSARVLRAFAFAIALSVFATCASAPTPKPHVETCRIIHAGPEAVWDALLQIVVAEAETVTVAQKDSGLISFRRSIPAEDVETIAFKGVMPRLMSLSSPMTPGTVSPVSRYA